MSANPFTEVALKTVDLIFSRRDAERLQLKRGTPAQQAQLKRLSTSLYAAAIFHQPAAAWATMLLWNWFVVPALGTPQIGFLLALGINWTITAVHAIIIGREIIEFESAAEGIDKTKRGIFIAIVMPFIYACIGWAIHGLMLLYN